MLKHVHISRITVQGLKLLEFDWHLATNLKCKSAVYFFHVSVFCLCK